MTALDVSRETEEMLRHYTDLLLKWTARINLIAPSTKTDVWTRHILDCCDAVVQPSTVTGQWCDIGSGGGLPGLVAAIVHRDRLSDVTLVESDRRKCAFLRTAARELGLAVTVIAERFERTELASPDILSARALAPLGSLLDLTSAHHGSNCTFLFMKGRAWREEAKEAGDRFSFTLETRPSLTDTDSATLLITNVQRRADV
jgi:16S rRNA (guanine527-N7)-methyltransferase